jgi:Flp pilus assembly pilin Flp
MRCAACCVLHLVRNDDAQDLVEYALLAAFVALVAIVGASALGAALNNWFGAVATNVNGSAASAS